MPYVFGGIEDACIGPVTRAVAAGDNRSIEMTRRFDNQSDGGEDMEVAMAAVVFRDLQQQGLIPAGTVMADDVPTNPAGLDGDSYEARLVELITDADGDNRLDLDMDRLVQSGIVAGNHTVDRVESVLTNGLREELSSGFLRNQHPDSELSNRYGGIERKGRRVQRYSRNMELVGSQDRVQSAFVDGLSEQVRTPAGAQAAAQQALGSAQLLTQRGDQRHAQELLEDTGAALMDAGRNAEAAQVYRELTRDPYADAPVNLMAHETEEIASFNPSNNLVMTKNGTESTIDVSDFNSTYGDLAQHRLGQIQTLDRMEQVVGRPVDPRNMNDMQAYFQAYAEGRSTDEVRGELQSYFETFHVHAGEGVTWSEAVPEDQRPARMTELLERQPCDKSGRTVVDCEGYSYMTQHLLEGIEDEDGEQRFDVFYATRPGHVISGAFDRSSGEGFSVNNDSTNMFTGDLTTERGRANALGSALSGGTYNVISFSDRPSASTPYDPGFQDGRPNIGAAIFAGDRVVGTVTPEFQQGFVEWNRNQFGGNVSQYIGHLVESQGARGGG